MVGTYTDNPKLSGINLVTYYSTVVFGMFMTHPTFRNLTHIRGFSHVQPFYVTIHDRMARYRILPCSMSGTIHR